MLHIKFINIKMKMKKKRKTTEQTQCCRVCKLDLSLESFHVDNRNRNNRYDVCRNCRSHHRLISRRSKTDYQVLLQAQNNSCAICFKTIEQNKKSFHLDHDHATDKVRGLLCTNCNLGLGLFKDNINYLSSARSYLLRDAE